MMFKTKVEASPSEAVAYDPALRNTAYQAEMDVRRRGGQRDNLSCQRDAPKERGVKES